MHTQRRYATCSKGMSKKKKRKDAYPKKVCHMPTRHVKEKKKRKKCSTHPRKTKKRGRPCKGVHPSSTEKRKHSTHLHILIRLYYSFLLGSCFWLSNISKANMPLHSYPELHISLIRWQQKRRQQLCLGEVLKQNEWFKRIIWGARLFFCFKI